MTSKSSPVMAAVEQDRRQRYRKADEEFVNALAKRTQRYIEMGEYRLANQLMEIIKHTKEKGDAMSSGQDWATAIIESIWHRNPIS
jgi:exonuclease III